MYAEVGLPRAFAKCGLAGDEGAARRAVYSFSGLVLRLWNADYIEGLLGLLYAAAYICDHVFHVLFKRKMTEEMGRRRRRAYEHIHCTSHIRSSCSVGRTE